MLPTAEVLEHLTPIGLHAASVAVDRKEERLSKLLGFHLGTLLHKDLLADMFLSQTEEPGVEDGEEKEAVPGSSKNTESYIPLALMLHNHQVPEILRRRAVEMSNAGEPSHEQPLPGVDVDLALLEQLQASARAADSQRKRRLEETKEARIEEENKILGITRTIKV